jgi:hypothetical protein
MSIDARQNGKPNGYLPLRDRKATGSHYTPKILADFVAASMLKAWQPLSNKERIRILDPAVGDGELLLSLLRELLKIRAVHTIEIVGFDTDKHAIEQAIARIYASSPDAGVTIHHEDFLEQIHLCASHDLFGLPSFDLIISNPPYVRTQVLGREIARVLARRFNLSGRIDLYHAFVKAIAGILEPDGVFGVIISNRFMTTKAGANLRSAILRDFRPVHVWDLGDTQLFEAAVLPAVLILGGRAANDRTEDQITFTSAYAERETGFYDATIHMHPDIITAIESEGVVCLKDGRRYIVHQGILNHGDSSEGVWHIADDRSNRWLDTIDAHTFCRFGDIGKVRVGVKTTCDAVFIRRDWNDLPEEEQPEVRRPLITHVVARRFKAIETADRFEILYTHEVIHNKRVPIDLEQLPRTEKYLNRYRSVLEGRPYIAKARRKWYEIWVPHNPNDWQRPKMVFRDIVERPTFWLDFSGAVVNGDCYWLSPATDQDQDLLWLAMAVANSTFIEKFYDASFHNKLYSGRRRFITQYVEKFPLPDPHMELSRRIISLAREIYDKMPNDSGSASDTTKLEEILDGWIWQSFGLHPKEILG